MIFVTVGTHEQPFNRLVKHLDNLVMDGKIMEEVFIQTGYSTYIPKHCEWSRFLPYREMEDKVSCARIVITHGGPASFIMPLQLGKIPVVVPRQEKFGEHVNDHQLDFCREVEKRLGNIILVEDMGMLERTVLCYETRTKKIKNEMENHNRDFVHQLDKLVNRMYANR